MILEVIMIHGYARVSTKKQLHGNSLEEQVQLLQQAKCDRIITEQFTGATTERPEFKKRSVSWRVAIPLLSPSWTGLPGMLPKALIL